MIKKMIHNWLGWLDFDQLKRVVGIRTIVVIGDEEQVGYIIEEMSKHNIRAVSTDKNMNENEEIYLRSKFFLVIAELNRKKIQNLIAKAKNYDYEYVKDYLSIEEEGKEYTYTDTQRRRFEDVCGNVIVTKSPKVLVNSSFIVKGFNNYIEIGEDCELKNVTIKCMYGSKVVIGRETQIYDSELKTDDCGAVIEIGRCCYFGKNCEMVSKSEISIGSKTSVHASGVIFADHLSPIHIGDDCMISWPVLIRSNNGHALLDLKTMENRSLSKEKYVNVGNHVWIGQGVNVISNSDIKDNCIIGAGSVVNSYIPNNSLAVGVPARVIKENMSWDEDFFYEF